MHRVFFIGLFWLVLAGAGCKTSPALRSSERDSTIYIERTKIDTIRELIIGDSILLQTAIWCDSLNNVYLKEIDSLGRLINIKTQIKNNVLYIKVKQRDFETYRLLIYKTIQLEIYKKSIKNFVIVEYKESPKTTTYKYLSLCLIILTLLLAIAVRFLLRRK